MSSDVDVLRPTPIFDEVDRWARDAEAAVPCMLTFRRPAEPAPGTTRTVLALLAAAREERTARHALRRS